MRNLIAIAVITSLLIACTKQEGQKTPAQRVESVEAKLAEKAEAPATGPTAPEQLGGEPAGQQPAVSVEAQTPSPLPPPPPKDINIEIVADASGSMVGLLPDATTKIDALKTALKELSSGGFARTRLALRAYGAKSPQEKNDCNDTELLAPLGGPAILSEAVDKITPQGTSPIAFALGEAAKDIISPPATSDNIVLLITDGIDSCGGDPCAAADRLYRSPSQIVTHVIGFDLSDEARAKLQCVTKAGGGNFYLARNITELKTALDQAVSQKMPFNLRVKVLSGATPLKSAVTVYQAGTQRVISRDEIAGVKFYELPTGVYDVEAEYTDSIETVKPTKFIRNVDVRPLAKTEQVLSFDLAGITLSSLDQNDQLVPAKYVFKRGGEEAAKYSGDKTTLYVTPGAYDLEVETTTEPRLTQKVVGLQLTAGISIEQVVKFEVGKLTIKAENITKEPIAFAYNIVNQAGAAILAGEAPKEGTTLDLPPGMYNIAVEWKDPSVKTVAIASLEGVEIKANELTEQTAQIVTALLTLSGKDNSGNPVQTEFLLEQADKKIATVLADKAPTSIYLAPGTYNITAKDITSKIVPAPSIIWTGLSINGGDKIVKEALFELGTLQLRGRNAKGQGVPTIFTVYRSGTDEPLVTETATAWISFKLTPGLYDVRSEDSRSVSDPKPTVWLHDLEIKKGGLISQEAVFTAGKLKLMCRGVNNVVLECEFNVFAFGADRALFSGKTSEDWSEFDIPAGKYYIEIGWHDPVEEQLLKKWINVAIEENQIIENIIGF